MCFRVSVYSSCSRVSSFRPFVCTCRMSMLWSMFLYVWFASMRWFAKVDSVAKCSAFAVSYTHLCICVCMHTLLYNNLHQ